MSLSQHLFYFNHLKLKLASSLEKLFESHHFSFFPFFSVVFASCRLPCQGLYLGSCDCLD